MLIFMAVKTNKERAQEFLKLAAKGQSREAFNLYVGAGFKHHNVFFKGDAETLMLAMEANAANSPDKVFEIQRTLQDGDLVAVHSHVRQRPNELGAALIHIFRFVDDKIVELWDFGQTVPSNVINEYGMF
jgi:predicted SnoaL-like aldol condensation-catalyzing enzyme